MQLLPHGMPVVQYLQHTRPPDPEDAVGIGAYVGRGREVGRTNAVAVGDLVGVRVVGFAVAVLLDSVRVPVIVRVAVNARDGVVVTVEVGTSVATT